MSLVIGDNFSYQGRNPLDSRMLFDTIAAMKNYNENYLPDITLAFNKEDGKMYVFNRTNDVDEDTGKWREFEGGKGESIQVEVLPSASENLGKVYQYIGETTNDYTHDYFYESKVDMLYCFNVEFMADPVYAKSETPQHGDTIYVLNIDTQEIEALPAELGYWDDATHVYIVVAGLSHTATRDSEGDLGEPAWVNVDVQPADYDKLENKPLEKTDITKSQFNFQFWDTDIGYRPIGSYELVEGAVLYDIEGEMAGQPYGDGKWRLHIDNGHYYRMYDGSISNREMRYEGEKVTVIGETAKVNGAYKDCFRVENLTNVKINDVKDGDVFTFRDEGQSLYAWQPLEGEPFYSEKEIPEEGDVVYESTGGVISKLPIDSYRWTTDHQAHEGFAFIRQASNPTPYYDIQVGRYPQSDIIKEKYWTNAESSGGSIQVSELPAATSENEGKVYQYIGADTQDYKHDFFYENKYTEGTNGYYAFLIEGGVEAYYATSETPSDGDPIFVNNEGEFMQIPLEIGYWVVDAESPSGYSIYAVNEGQSGGGQSMPTTRDSTQDIPGEPGGYQRVSVEVQEGNYDTLKNKPVYVGTTTQQGYGRTVEYDAGGGQTETYDFLSLVEELPENGIISVYDAEYDEWFDLEMVDGLAFGEDTVTRNSSIDQDVTVTTKEVNEKYYDIIGITELPTPSSEYVDKIYRYVGNLTNREGPSDYTIAFNNQDLVICKEINGSYYWIKYGMSTSPAYLPTYWEGGYGETYNNYYYVEPTIVLYEGKLYTGTVDWSTFQWTWEELPTGTDDYNDLENKPLELEETTVNAYAFTIDAGASMGVTVYTKEITNGATLYRILNGKLEPFSENATLVINGSSYATDSGVPMTRHQENDIEATLYIPKVNEPYTELFQNLSAGTGIKIYDDSDYSAIQGPCENGFHIPQSSEWTALQSVITTPTELETLLHLPFAGCLQSSGNLIYSGTNHYYWNSSVSSQAGYAEHLYSFNMSDEYYPTNNSWRKYAMPIRAFKDVPVIPDNTWTETLTNTVWEKDGLISILVDTNTYVTVKDKNEGATVVYNHGDDLTEANRGKCFQRGNNYGFSLNGETVIATTVNTTGYSRENPYSSSEFHYPSGNDWSNPSNDELWGATTGVRELTDAIVNTGVLSINGKNGYVTLDIPQSLPELSDVNITNIKDKQIIHYDTATQKYVNVAPTEYEAGTGIVFAGREVLNDCSAMQGPCPEGRHIPSKAEADAFVSAIPYSTSEEKEIAQSALHFPPAGWCRLGNNWEQRGSLSRVWQSSIKDEDDAYILSVEGSLGSTGIQNPTNAMPIRPFKDNPVVPDSTWTETITGVAWYKASEGLISIKTGDNSYLTLMDKNLGATTVWNYGDSPTDANCGKYFQWGNNYPFDWGKRKDTEKLQNVTGYGPSEYNSNTFVAGYYWMTPYAPNLRGMQTGVQPLYQPGSVINNTITTLDSVTNVEINNVQDKDVLKFSSSSQKWHNEQPITYSAGTGISFTSETTYDYSAIKGPCPDGFHVMTVKEAGDLDDALSGVFGFDEILGQEYLKMPTDGFLSGYEETGKISGGAGDAYVWVNAFADPTETGETTRTSRLKMNYQDGIDFSPWGHKGDGVHIRPIKNEYVEPDSSWTTLYSDGDNGIYHNATLGLISIKCVDSEHDYTDRSDYYPNTDWTGTVNVHITMSDKNLGATQVRDPNDSEITDANGGLYYQWGNNFGFSHDREGTDYDSSTAISTTGYAPSTFSNNEFIYIDDAGNGGDWSIEHNPDLWGGVTGVVEVPGYDQTITNTITTLGALTDVETNNVQDGDIIAYNAASLKYKNIKNDPYIAGEGISLEPTTKTINDYSAMRGPCPEGFHIPSGLGNLNSIINSLSDYKKLHMPTNCGYWAGEWMNRNEPESGWTDTYWQTDPGYYAGEGYAWHFDEYNHNFCGSTDASATYGLPIRAFRDEVVLPDSTWTEELTGKIWHNAALGLITYFDGTNYYTMADKNVGATQVWNDGDTCTDANVGLYFQQGNNYGYHYGDTVPTTDELIDVSSVAPSTYSSATWGSADHSSRWDEVNADIWGEETRSQLKTIAKTGIQNLSMNESDVAFATVTLTGTTATLSNAFVTAETFVDYIVKNGTPAGTITITVANGTVTLSSTATENLILLLRLEKVNSKSVILN